MKIRKLNAGSTSKFDFKAFSNELQKLSDRFGIKLVSLGALSGLNDGNGMYLAMWETEK